MGRTKSDGLDYFPLDVGFFKDPRIRRLTKRFGADGPAFYLYTLCTAYSGSGYYVIKDEEFIEDAAIDLECTPEKIGLMLEYLLDRSLLMNIPSSTVNYLTSHGIQAQYQRSAKGKRRDIEVSATLWILDKSESEGFIKVRHFENKSGNYPINPGNKLINPGNKPQSKVKESKVKESKSTRAKAPAERVEADFERFWLAYPRKVAKQTAKKAFYKVNAPIDVLLAAIERQKHSAQWSKDNGQYIPHPATWLNQRRWEDEIGVETPAETVGQSEYAASWELIARRDPKRVALYEAQARAALGDDRVNRILERLRQDADMKNTEKS